MERTPIVHSIVATQISKHEIKGSTYWHYTSRFDIDLCSMNIIACLKRNAKGIFVKSSRCKKARIVSYPRFPKKLPPNVATQLP